MGALDTNFTFKPPIKSEGETAPLKYMLLLKNKDHACVTFKTGLADMLIFVSMILTF